MWKRIYKVPVLATRATEELLSSQRCVGDFKRLTTANV
jgi:hypothetical protein